MTSNRTWQNCGAYGGPQRVSGSCTVCAACGAKFPKDGPPFAGIHPSAQCPVGITPPEKGADDQAAI